MLKKVVTVNKLNKKKGNYDDLHKKNFLNFFYNVQFLNNSILNGEIKK